MKSGSRMRPTTRARKCFAMSTWSQKIKSEERPNFKHYWSMVTVTRTVQNVLLFTSERLRSPRSLQRSQTVFSPTRTMTNRPTNFTPRAPARFTPISTSHSHQGAVKGLKTTASREQSCIYKYVSMVLKSKQDLFLSENTGAASAL